MVTVTGVTAEAAMIGYTWDEDEDEYVLSGGRIFVGPTDPETAGFTLQDGDEWINPDVLPPDESPAYMPSSRTAFTGGTMTFNSQTWANFPNIGTVAIAAVVGDILEVSAGMLWDSQAVIVRADIVTEVAAAPVNSIGMFTAAPTGSTDVYGIGSLTSLSGVALPVSACRQYVVQAGDISGGTVTLRLRYRLASATNKTIQAGSAPVQLSVVNLGQP